MLKSKYSVNSLCKVLKCSKSGYYDWIKLGRPQNKAYNEFDNELVVRMHEKNKTWGIRQIRMQIKKIYGVILTNHTVYRYMRLNNIQSITRKKTHRYSKTPHHQIPNLLQRNFTTFSSNMKWSIDISYIFANDGVKYLCAIKDMFDKSIITYTVSKSLELPLVLETVKNACDIVPYEQRKELILHSDQGWHFTNMVYQTLLKQNNITRLKEYTKECMNIQGIKKLETSLGNISIRKTPASVKILDETKIPLEYLNVKQVTSIDKKTLLDDLKDGLILEGIAELSQGTSLTIK